jgi:hypothetical protein
VDLEPTLSRWHHGGVAVPKPRPTPDCTRDAAVDAAARAELLRIDGMRDLGTNLEQADALIRAAFVVAAALSCAD